VKKKQGGVAIMNAKNVRFFAALIVAPATPAFLFYFAALPSSMVVFPMAKALLIYGYLAAFLVAAPVFFIFKKRFSEAPALIILLGAVVGALTAMQPFFMALLGEGLSASDWHSFLGMGPVLIIGGALGVISGVVFFLLAGSSLSERGTEA
jgi:hypothetical protein